jgi:hypothetical protein
MVRKMSKSRTTEWRHRTGRSRPTPKGECNYRAVALAIVRRFFPHLWEWHRADVWQECELLDLEATLRKRITVRGRKFGNGSDRMGIKSFSRAAQARLYDMSIRYGWCRRKGSRSFSLREEKGGV